MVEGRGYPVEVRYRPLTDEIVTGSDDDSFDDVEDNLPRTITAAVEECYQDAASKGHADQADILILRRQKRKFARFSRYFKPICPRRTQILPLFARQSLPKATTDFHPTGGRRIIIATNVAETALTVPNIRYVADLGLLGCHATTIARGYNACRLKRLAKLPPINEKVAVDVSRRACVSVYIQRDFTSRPEFTEPEILRTNLASVILQMANLVWAR